jgi:predicted transcriptional regulator
MSLGLDMTRKYRNKLEIIADILKVVSKNSSKTGIMKAANLNMNYENRYLEIALISGLLVASNDKHEITEKVKEFLEKYNELTCKLN